MKKSITATLMFAAMLTVLITACSPAAGDGQAPAGGANGGSGATIFGEGDHLIIAAGAMAVNMHPHNMLDMHSAYLVNLVYDPLFRLNYATMEVEYALAESSEMSDDLMSLRVTLRPGVTFHNGDPLTAEVVRDSLYGSRASSLVGFIVAMIDNIEVHDDLNLTINLTQPFAPFRNHLTHGSISIIHPDTTNDNPIGTGAFIQESIILGDRVEFVANENFWGPRSHINRITWRAVPESTARLIEVESGGAHVAWNIRPSDIPRILEDPNLALQRNTSVASHHLAFQAEKTPFYDIRVRHAVAYALDIPLLSYTAYEGSGSPADSFITSVITYHYSIPARPQNIERALELMAEAGFPDGFSTTIEFYSENPVYGGLAVMISSMLREINIEATVIQFELGQFLERILSGQHELMLVSWNTMTGDADYGLFDTQHSTGFPMGGNQSFFQTPQIDRLLEEGRAVYDTARRAEIYREIQQLIHHYAAYIPIHHDERIHATVHNLRGFDVNPTGIIDLWNVYFD